MNASRMLQRDLRGVTDTVPYMTYSNKVKLEAIGAENIAEHLSDHSPELSPLFDAQMLVISGMDGRLTDLLTGFRTAYSALACDVQNVRHEGNAPWGIPACVELIATLQSADDYARAALYLLPLHELGTFRRAWRCLRRRARAHADNRARLRPRPLRDPKAW